VTARTQYVAAYWAPNGNYSYTSNFFAASWTNNDRTMTAVSGADGVYRYGSDAFPTSTYGSSNYYVEPLFVPDSMPEPPTPPTLPTGSQTLFEPPATPAVTSWDDNSSIEVGGKFTATTAGKVLGDRYRFRPAERSSATGRPSFPPRRQVTTTGWTWSSWRVARNRSARG
jgi:hypothetical protein